MRLFTRDHVPCVLDAIAHKVQTFTDEPDRRLCVLTLRVDPCDRELLAALGALELVCGLQSQPRPYLRRVDLAISLEPQDLDVRYDPELPRLTIPDARIGLVSIRVDDEGTVSALIRATVINAEPAILAALCAWHTETRAVTFAPAQPSLFDEADAGAPTIRRVVRPVG